jgi:hypothetical protein
MRSNMAPGVLSRQIKKHQHKNNSRGLPIDDRMSQNSKIYRPRRKARS